MTASDELTQLSLFGERNTLYVIEVSTDDGWDAVTSTRIDWVARQCRKRLSRNYDVRTVVWELGA